MIRALVLGVLLATGSLVAAQATGNRSLPFEIGGAFDLIDQNGQPRSQSDPDGWAQLLYFGYANCPGICTTALPMMADVTDLLADQGLKIRPVMITVDPKRDRVGTMNGTMARLHPDFVGLTGSEAALAQAYQGYFIEKKVEYIDPEYGEIFSHGTFIYLLDASGEVLTLLPPILTAQRVATIVQGYLEPKE